MFVILPLTASRESGISLDELLKDDGARFWTIFWMKGIPFGLGVMLLYWVWFGSASILTSICGGALYGLLMGIYLRRRSWRSAPAGRRAMLAFHVCPSCGFDLSALSPEPDGCVVCPECAAAWRLPA